MSGSCKMDEKDIKRLEELKNNSSKTSNGIIKEALGLLSIHELGKLKFLIIFSLSILLDVSVSFQLESGMMIKEIAEIWQDIVLAIFGIAFTAHSIFQALLSPKLIYVMVRTDDNEDNSISSFSGTNAYFVCYMMLSFIIIILNALIIVCDIIIPENWNLCQSRLINSTIFFLLCLPYFYCSICWIVEMKSVISNIYNMYNVSATDKYIDELNRKND